MQFVVPAALEINRQVLSGPFSFVGLAVPFLFVKMPIRVFDLRQ